MVSKPDLALWIVGTVASAFVCGLIILRGRLRRYRMLACYFGVIVLVEAMRARVFLYYGINSIQYMYFYYYTDCLQSLLFYLAIVEHFVRVSDSSTARKYVRIGAFLLAACLGVFCVVVVAQSSARVVTHLVVEYSEYLFMGAAGLGLLAFVTSLRNQRVLFYDRMLAFVLASYPALIMWQYLVRNLYPRFAPIVYTGTWLWLLLLLGIAYIFSDPATGNDGPYIYL